MEWSFSLKNKELITAYLGNTLEWFDFGLFIFMAPIIGTQFFPQNLVMNSTFNALIVFTLGFLCRPLGGIFFGYFGDTRGRVKTLKASILIITLSTVLIGLIPSYKDIGIWASILFIFLRMLQGFSVGGEYVGIMIYLAETAPENKRGLSISFGATNSNLGFLLAIVAFFLLNRFFSPEEMSRWAWRLPFILIGLPGALLIYYRFKLSETPVYSRLKQNNNLSSMPLIAAFKYAPSKLLKILGLTSLSSTFYYFFIGYIPIYLEYYIKIPKEKVFLIQGCLLILMLIMVPLGGICGDKFGRKKIIIIIALMVLIFILPCFYLLQTKSIFLIGLTLFFAISISALDLGNTGAAIIENCPENVRYSGVAFSYNLGNALFGGCTPLVLTLLIENINVIAPAYYLILMALISLYTATTLVNKNQSLGPLIITSSPKKNLSGVNGIRRPTPF